MATIESGYMGGFSGKLGPAVGYQWRGKWVVRSFSRTPRNPRTERQQEHRMLFKQEVQLAGRMNWVLRETMDEVSALHGMTPCNYFIKRNQGAFSVGSGPCELSVDWSALVLSEGPVAPVAFGAPEVTEGTTLSIGFERNPLHTRADNYDRVFVYLYCPALERGFLAAPVYRREGRLSVALPELFGGHEVQLWGMVQDAAGRWSETIYIGFGPLEDTVAEASPQDTSDEESPVAVGQQPDRQRGSVDSLDAPSADRSVKPPDDSKG